MGHLSHISSFAVLAACIGCGYVFIKGLLCCIFDVCAWALKILGAEENAD